MIVEGALGVAGTVAERLGVAGSLAGCGDVGGGIVGDRTWCIPARL
jgi:hypothetical protein